MTETPAPKPNARLFGLAAVIAVVVAATAIVLVLRIQRAETPTQAVTRYYAATSCNQIRQDVTDALWAAEYQHCDNATVAATGAALKVSIISTATTGATATIKAEVTNTGTATDQPPSSSVVVLDVVKVSGKWKVNSDGLAPTGQ